MEPTLERDPAGLYAAMDAHTQERYRRACHELAAGSGRTPAEVAAEAVRLASEQPAEDPRARHIGAWLIAERREALEAKLSCRFPPAERRRRFARRHATALFIGGVLGLAALMVLAVEALLVLNGAALLHRILVPLVLVLPALELAQEWVEAFILRIATHPELLPKLDPARALGPETRTLVVNPLLVGGADDIDLQLRRMESNHLGNVSPDLLFALLTDFPDASEETLPHERALLDRMERGVRELNERHGHLARPRFFLLHRARRWNAVAGRWMGWERKRGKIDELNRLLLGATDTSYVAPLPEALRGVRYVITLDADNVLPPGSGARMVATLHHPLNRARRHPDGRSLTAGYSMLQPSVVSTPTRAHWRGAGLGPPVSIVREAAIGPTTPLHSAFGTGEFFGKGIYDVAAFAGCLEGRIPENAVLSHDKLEGMFARVAYARDVWLFEGSPVDLASTGRIWHRWIRGDWQLLPWLFPSVPARAGREPSTLSAIDRWTLLGDLRRSLSSPSAVVVLAYGWLALPASLQGAWALATSVWLLRKTFVGPLIFAVRHAFARRDPGFLLRIIPRIVTESAFVTIAVLLPFTGISLDAITRALYRLGFDRRRILDWTTHAQGTQRVGAISSIALPEVRAAAALAFGLLALIAAFNPSALLWAAPWLIAWMPLAVIVRGAAAPRMAPLLAPPELDRLRVLARRAWAVEEKERPAALERRTVAGARDVPAVEESEHPAALERRAAGDTEPERTVTPTDLALWLLAPLSAYHLGYLDLSGLAARLEATLSVVAGLERHRGHLFERYDLHARRPLEPRRISAAESGVLTAALVVVEAGLRAARERPASARVLRLGLQDSLAVLIEESAAAPASPRRDRLLSLLDGLLQTARDPRASPVDVLAALDHRDAQLAAERLAQRTAAGSEVEAWWDRFSAQRALLERVARPSHGTTTAPPAARLDTLQAWLRSLREEVDFTALYDAEAALLLDRREVRPEPPVAVSNRVASTEATPALDRSGAGLETLPSDHREASVEATPALDRSGAGLETLPSEAAPALEHRDAGPETLHADRREVSPEAPPATTHAQLSSGAVLAGFLAIARRQAPLRHWQALLTTTPEPSSTTAGLAERLLPSLLLWYPPATVLAERALHAIDTEIATAAARERPWAAPGPSLLAIRFRPGAAFANFQRVAALDVATDEAPDRRHALTLAAVANLACDDVLVRHFHQHWQTAWVEPLIFETRGPA